MLPISTTNMTGLRATCRGSNFLLASFIARFTIGGSKRRLFCLFLAILFSYRSCGIGASKHSSQFHQEMLHDRTKRKHRKES
jgi:hypothetical protein